MTENSNALDKQWFERFSSLGVFSVVDFFEEEKAQREKQREAFIAGKIDHPIFEYPRIDRGELNQRREALLQLQDDIHTKERHTIVRESYTAVIQERITAIDLLIATSAKDMLAFNMYSERMHGSPSPDIWKKVIGRLMYWLDTVESEQNTEAIHRGRVILEKYQYVPYQNEDKELINFSISPIEKEFTVIADSLVSDEVRRYSAANASAVIENAIRMVGIFDWGTSIEKTSKMSISVDHNAKLLRIPATFFCGADRLRQVIVHEIFTHIMRRENGAQQPLRLLAFGLDKYYPSEEGIAIIREEAVKPKEFRVVKSMLFHGVALALGYAGSDMTFKEIYEEMIPFFELQYLLRGTANAKIRAQQQAWTTCVRIFRGTDCKTPGAVFTKDYAYAEGRIRILELLRENPEEAKRFNAGKYDPTNERHVAWLDELGITA